MIVLVYIYFCFTGRLQSQEKEHSLLREREEQRARENAELQSRVAELEKNRASAEVELRSVLKKQQSCQLSVWKAVFICQI